VVVHIPFLWPGLHTVPVLIPPHLSQRVLSGFATLLHSPRSLARRHSAATGLKVDLFSLFLMPYAPGYGIGCGDEVFRIRPFLALASRVTGGTSNGVDADRPLRPA